MQALLYRHLLGAALLALGLELVPSVGVWGMTAALGFCVTAVYYWMLGLQVLKLFIRGRRPSPFHAILALAGRQALSLLACLLAFRLWGMAGWGCVLAMLLGRQWVMVAARAIAPRLDEAC